jgi:hypothetical protein
VHIAHFLNAKDLQRHLASLDRMVVGKCRVCSQSVTGVRKRDELCQACLSSKHSKSCGKVFSRQVGKNHRKACEQMFLKQEMEGFRGQGACLVAELQRGVGGLR